MRRNENLKIMTVMDIFYRVFSNEVLPVKFIRNLGLEGNLSKLARVSGLFKTQG
jgi:hypothetical protein